MAAETHRAGLLKPGIVQLLHGFSLRRAEGEVVVGEGGTPRLHKGEKWLSVSVLRWWFAASLASLTRSTLKTSRRRLGSETKCRRQILKLSFAEPVETRCANDSTQALES